MSDAMTNREIEDVLTSIRRLVAQEGGRGPEAGKLVLTAAQRVGVPMPVAEKLLAPEAALPDSPVDQGDGDFGTDDDFVFDPVDYAAGPFVARDPEIPAPDFGRLEATIAELEAAVSASGQGFETEAEGEAPRASNVTELYGRLHFAHRAAENLVTKPEIAKPAGEPKPVQVEAEDPAEHPAEAAKPEEAPVVAEAVEDDILDTVIDEAMLRHLVAQIVREELHGQLGERITQQVRKLVRAEIAKALDDRSFL